MADAQAKRMHRALDEAGVPAGPARDALVLAARLRAQVVEERDAWASIAAEVVKGQQHADWRWLLADLRERCFAGGIECPYSVTKLMQMAAKR